MTRDISALVASLQVAGGDATSIEVKSNSGGLPDSLTSALSAMANLPGAAPSSWDWTNVPDSGPFPFADPRS